MSGAEDAAAAATAERRAARRAALRPAAQGEPAPTVGDVDAAYRWLLGRPPESEAVVRTHLEHAPTLAALRDRLMRSPEFRRVSVIGFIPGPPLDAAPIEPVPEPGPEALEAMLVRARRGWVQLAEEGAHHSVLPDPRFRPETLPAHLRGFYATGREDRDRLAAVLHRLGLGGRPFHHLVEFGCGVGRATVHLATLCPEVTGIDHSPPHLEAARAEAKLRGLAHLRFLRSRPDAPMPAGACDLWFSRRALQWNPPPVMRAVLRLAFAALRPGGVAVFQLPTWGEGYRFDPAAHLAGPERPGLHALPQAEVFALAAEAGLAVLEVQEDVVPGLDRRLWLSHVFVVRRPG